MDYDLVIDADGPALVLAGATVTDPDTKSGNDAHEIDSGRFGSKPRAKAQGTRPASRAQVAGIRDNPTEVRRRDAVVDAARTIMDLSPDGIREFVRKRWSGTKVLTDADVEAFSFDARRQRIDDAVDALDYRIRRSIFSRSNSRVVKVDFPRGLIRGSLRNMDDTEVNEVLQRLRYRGWTLQQVKKHVIRPYALKGRDAMAGLSDEPDPLVEG